MTACTRLFGFLKKKSSSQEIKLEKELDRVEAAFKKIMMSTLTHIQQT
jgi:hypothetical protein